MNPKIAIVSISLVGLAAAMFGLAVTGSSKELLVADVIGGAWPPAAMDPETVASTKVAVVGYCIEVDRAVGPRWIDIVNAPLEEAGYDQPRMRIEIAPGASLPDEARVKAWTRVRGTYDPRSQRFVASQVEMKCPSAEQARTVDPADPAAMPDTTAPSGESAPADNETPGDDPAETPDAESGSY